MSRSAVRVSAGVAVWDDSAPGEWEELAGHLGDVDEMLATYVAFPSDEARWAVTLWTAHSHLVDCFDSTPRLALLSPEPGSGKTRTLEVLDVLCARAIHASNSTPAALFRSIDERRPTVLLDEADATFRDNAKAEGTGDLRALINAGHRRGATTLRCVGPTQQVVEFPAFAPVALAGIGDLPETIMHRAVVIRMRRRAPGETVAAFRVREAERVGHAIRDRLTAWTENNADRISEAVDSVVMPDGVMDRDADVWEALIVVGEAAGEPWADRARTAATKLTAPDADALTLGIQLLADLRRVFADVDRLKSQQVCDRLNELEESPWGDLYGKSLDPRGLARRLKKHGIRPKQIRFEGGITSGYAVDQFHDSWTRYLPAVDRSPTSPTAPTNDAETTKKQGLTCDVEDSSAAEGADGLSPTVGDLSPTNQLSPTGKPAVTSGVGDVGDVGDIRPGLPARRPLCRACGNPCVTFDDDGLPCHPNCEASK